MQKLLLISGFFPMIFSSFCHAGTNPWLNQVSVPVAPTSTAFVPLAVAPVAPAVPTPPKVRGSQFSLHVAVFPLAVMVKVVLAWDVF